MLDMEKKIRSSHNQRSGDFIDEFKRDLGLDMKEANAIKRIACSHRVVPLDSLDECEAYGQGGNIRIKLLSALIRLADELDFFRRKSTIFSKRVFRNK